MLFGLRSLGTARCDSIWKTSRQHPIRQPSARVPDHRPSHARWMHQPTRYPTYNKAAKARLDFYDPRCSRGRRKPIRDFRNPPPRSTRSARTRSASAGAFVTASSRVAPCAATPGRFATPAVQCWPFRAQLPRETACPFLTPLRPAAWTTSVHPVAARGGHPTTSLACSLATPTGATAPCAKVSESAPPPSLEMTPS